ncbi:cytochrome P450 7A1-like [Watersipora subatra]|uniref:cytochrome P450 7A1-like n=1 Tax=Watersipora subatra TaxID=2589382 RepID=UPI00355B1BCF
MIVSLVLGLVASTCFIIYKTRGILWGRNRKTDEPPLIPGHLLWGNGEQFNNDSVNFILDCQKKHGSVFSIRMLHYFMTVIADPHSFEAFSKERSFDFEPIQEQVNGNIFGFQIPESRKMIKFIGKTTRGSAVPRNLQSFSKLLNQSFADFDSQISPDWQTDSLDHLTNVTLFKTIFNSIFGEDKESPNFNYHLFHSNFKIFHKYFSYLWLGLPHWMFPEATKAVGKLFSQPSTSEFMQSDCTSEYLKAAVEYLREYNLSEKDIQCHNLVFLHINMNTLKIATWCLYQMMNHKSAMMAVREELDNLIRNNRDSTEVGKAVTISPKEIEDMQTLDSLVQETFRMASGVFMVRHNQKDVNFTVTATDETFRIRGGDKVMMYPPAIHKDPEIFERPEEFQYDRFIGRTFYKSGMKLKNPVLPFGSICPGRKIALLQTKWYIISMLHRYDFELLDGETCDFDTSYPGHEIVPATNDVQMRYRLRNAPTAIQVQHEC